MSSYTREDILKIVLNNIEKYGIFFSAPNDCPLCIDAKQRADFQSFRFMKFCGYCRLRDIVDLPHTDSESACCLYVHKGRRLGEITNRLKGNRGALRALARKVCLG